MKKILALDPGDQWIGTALSDSLRMIAKPYQTTTFDQINSFLTTLLNKETIEIGVVGYPLTLKGKESEQTKKIIAFKKMLETQFPQIKWVLWDERFSSQQAETLKKVRSKEEKIKAHSVAAALILERYLDYLRMQEQLQ